MKNPLSFHSLTNSLALSFALLIGSTLASSADTIAYDGADHAIGTYSMGNTIIGVNGGTGFASPWEGNGWSVQIPPIRPDLYSLSTSGAKVTEGVCFVGNHGRAKRKINIEENETVYISFIFQSSGVDASVYNAIELYNGSNRALQIGFLGQDALGDVNTHFYARVNDAYLSSPIGSTDNKIHLFVLQIESKAGETNDEITIWLDPDSGDNEPITIEGFDIIYDTIALASYNGTSLTVDEIRIGEKWSDVTTASRR